MSRHVATFVLLAAAILLLTSGCSLDDETCDPASYGSACAHGSRQICLPRDCADSPFPCSRSNRVVEDPCGEGYRCFVEAARQAECLPVETNLACVADPPLADVPNDPDAVVHDMDGDGTVDLITHSGNVLEVRRGKGDRTFEAARTVDAGSTAKGFQAGDFDGDGRTDLVVFADDSIGLLRASDGALAFDLPDVTKATARIERVAVADVDGDGTDDVIAVTDSPAIELFLGKHGRLERSTKIPKVIASDFVVADLDGDRKPDLAALDMFQDTLTVWVGRGDGSFDAPVVLKTSRLPSAVAVADVDNDGIADVVITSFSMGHVDVHRGTGGGAFELTASFSAHLNPASLGVADVDGDGSPDLVLDTSNRHSFVVFRGHDGKLDERPTAFDPTRENVRILGLADLDNDGRSDLLVSGPRGLSIVRRSCF